MNCSLCGVCLDSHPHLFFECSFANEVWRGVRMEMDWNGVLNTWDAILEALNDRVLAPKGLKRKLILAASVYMIWRERNRRLFTDHKRPTRQLIKDICSVIHLRLAWKIRQKRNNNQNVVAR